jgi:microcystin-dependent protein
MEADTVNDQILFWEFNGSTWVLVATLNLSDGLFRLAEQYAGGDYTVTAVYPRLNKASNLIISDNIASNVEDQIFVTSGLTKKIASWLDQSYVSWGSIFANTQNQIRLLNTDPDVTGPSAGPSGSNTRLNGGGGVLLSLEKLAGPTDQQVLRITNGDIAQSANNKFFVLGLSDLGGTVSLFTDELNRVAIYTTGDPNDPKNSQLVDSLTVFGSELIYSPDVAKLRVDVDAGFPTASSVFLSRGYFNGAIDSEWEFRLGNTANFSDRAFRLIATDLSNTATMVTAELASVDDRAAYTPKIAIGGNTKAIAEVEIGYHNAGRLGLGQISPALGNSYAAGYYSMNAFRERGTTASAVWTLRGDGSTNGGMIEWSSSDGKTLSFLLMPSTSGSNRVIPGDAFLSTESSITMKRTLSSSAKLFIDSFAYTQLSDTLIGNAPHLVIGATSSPLSFNFGNAARGIGLYGAQSAIEWLTNQNGFNATGFRVIGATAFIGATASGGTAINTLSTQYRSYIDSTWKNAITVISEDFTAGGTYSGNVIIGSEGPSTTVGKAKFSVVGSSGPTGNGSISLGSPEIVDFKTAGLTSMFTLDRDGNVVAGIRFGNKLYNSTDRYTLDHYEEGTWIPILSPQGYTAISGWDNNKYKVYKANYTRVGNRVHVDYTIKIDGLSISPGNFPGATGAMFISGLPYKPDYENVIGVGATVTDPANPQYPVVPLKSSGFSRGVASDAEAGTIKAWPGALSTIPEGWTACNGAAYSTSAYPDLNAVLSTAGFSGVLPDLRGYFIRGCDNGAGIDIGRVLGSIQQDELKSHHHTYRFGEDTTSGNNNHQFAKLDSFNIIRQTDDTGGVETRPKNVALNYIIALGRSTATVGMNSGEMGGGFVLFEGTKSRLYLYSYPPGSLQTLSRLNINDIPVGSDSYLYGSFEYFISETSTSPLVNGGQFTYNIGNPSFGFSINALISSDTPLTSVTVTGQPSWMTYNSTTGFMEFSAGVTQVPGPTATYSLLVTALNSGSPLIPGTGSVSVFTTLQTAPIVRGVGSTSHDLTQAFTLGYTASQGPITSWELFWYNLGATVTLTDPTVTLSTTGGTASVNFSSAYPGPGSNPAFQNFWIQAFNNAGVGATAFQVVMTTPGGTPLYFLANSSGPTANFGTWNIDIYDSAVGGNLVGNASYYIGNYSNVAGLFTNYFALGIGTTYYVKATAYSNEVLESGSSYVNEAGTYQYFTSFTTPPPTYNTPSRLPFVYNGSNTINLNILSLA